MTIYLKKFGTILISRPSGKESWLAYQPVLKDLPEAEEILVDFDGVVSLSPSWTDEFLVKLHQLYHSRVRFLPTKNPSVQESLKIVGL